MVFKTVGSRKFLELFSNKRRKSKAIPVQVWTDPEGSRRYWLPDFKTVGT
jgi:hypothetical protein